jgi:hypothetical protein
MMPHERRHSVRKMPEHLAYLSLPPNNGGIVVDVSEGGLAFCAIAPVKADGPIHFRFAIDSATRIKAVGELAWIDETGKNGGLRFTQLPEGVREQIRTWASQVDAGTKEKAKESAKTRVLNVSVAESSIVEVAAGSGVDLAVVSKTEHPLLDDLKPPIYRAPFYGLSMFPLGQNSGAEATAVVAPSTVGIRHPIAAVGLTIVLAFLVSIGIIAYASTGLTGESLFDLGEKMWSEFHSQTIPGDPGSPASTAPDPSLINPQ